MVSHMSINQNGNNTIIWNLIMMLRTSLITHFRILWICPGWINNGIIHLFHFGVELQVFNQLVFIVLLICFMPPVILSSCVINHTQVIQQWIEATKPLFWEIEGTQQMPPNFSDQYQSQNFRNALLHQREYIYYLRMEDPEGIT